MRRSGLITEMRSGLIVSDRHFLSLVSVLLYRSWRSYHSRFAVTGSFRSIRLGTTSARVPPTRVSRRFTTGWLIKLLTSFTQPTKWSIAHERFGSSSDPRLNGHLHYPDDTDRSLNEDATHRIRKYRADYNNNPPNDISFMSAITSKSGRLHSEFVRLLFLQDHWQTYRFFCRFRSSASDTWLWTVLPPSCGLILTTQV